MIQCAVIGNPIAHSLSPVIHQQFAHQAHWLLTYEKILGDLSQFESQVVSFFNEGGSGLNITLPFKQRAFAMANVVTPRCSLAKAANTLWVREGILYADNTDGIGFIRSLTHLVDLNNKKILLVGGGGAARGIIAPLLASSIEHLTVAHRHQEKADALLVDFQQLESITMDKIESSFDIIINATSASLIKDDLSLPSFLWENKPFCYDLAYSVTKETPFVTLAIKKGCVAVDGLGMLVEQAAEAFYIWHGFMPETTNLLCSLRLKKS